MPQPVTLKKLNWTVLWRPTIPFRTNTQKRYPFQYRGLECKVKWALGSITMNKASGGDGIPVEVVQILKDDAVRVLHSICQKIWKTQQWPRDWKRSVFILIPKKGNAKEGSNYHTIALISVQFSSVVQSFSRVWLFATPWIAACQASLSITNSWSSLRLTPIKSVRPSSTHLTH